MGSLGSLGLGPMTAKKTGGKTKRKRKHKTKQEMEQTTNNKETKTINYGEWVKELACACQALTFFFLRIHTRFIIMQAFGNIFPKGLLTFYAVVTPLRKAASYEPRITILGIRGDTWLTRGKYGIYVAVRGSYGALTGSIRDAFCHVKSALSTAVHCLQRGGNEDTLVVYYSAA